MDWTKTWDDNDNDIWEALAPYVDGYYWRLKQRLRDNKIYWYEAHDADLLDSPNPDWAEHFETLEEAKHFVETVDEECRVACIKDYDAS